MFNVKCVYMFKTFYLLGLLKSGKTNSVESLPELLTSDFWKEAMQEWVVLEICSLLTSQQDFIPDKSEVCLCFFNALFCSSSNLETV